MTSENVYIIQPVTDQSADALHAEAVALIESAGASYAGTMYAKIREINPATYLGEGKIAELRERLAGLDLTILFNGELSPAQTVNLSEALEGKKVIDPFPSFSFKSSSVQKSLRFIEIPGISIHFLIISSIFISCSCHSATCFLLWILIIL